MRHLRLIPVLFICLFLTGGHYGMLQCVAWAGMWWSYSEDGGRIEGAEKTFNGENPCCLCEAIADAKQGDSDSPEPMQVSGMNKLKDLQCPKVAQLKSPMGTDVPGPSHADPVRLTGSWFEAPMPPPPRFVV